MVDVEVEEVASAAALSEVVTERRVVFVRVTAPFVAGGVAYATNDVLVWDTMPVPGAWRRIYTEPPQTVVPAQGAALGALVAPVVSAPLVVVDHELAAGKLLFGSAGVQVAGALAFGGWWTSSTGRCSGRGR